MRCSIVLLTVMLVSSLGGTAQAQMRPNTQRGAVAGGLAGAIAGAIIGENNDKAGGGALIGGAVGALAGSAFGNARDKELEYQQQAAQYQAQQQYYAAEQRQVIAVQSAVSLNDVITMSRSGIGDSVLINQIQQRGVQRRLEVSDIIQLHQNGVTEPVITAMQRANVGAPQPSPVIVQERTPVYVERQIEVRPTYVVPAPRYYHYPHGRHYYRGW
jgi:uncharacterized membrane protein